MLLKDMRKQAGITQEALASHVGVTQQAIARYENNERKLPIDVAKRAADLFGCEWPDFYEDEARDDS